MGRPLKFESVEELQKKIDEYFDSCCEFDDDGNLVKILEPFTITGLALALGTYRQTLCNYEGKEDFVDTIKTAKARCEHYAEKLLLSGGNPTGAIFALKNYNWSDKQTIEHEGGLKTKVEVEFI